MDGADSSHHVVLVDDDPGVRKATERLVHRAGGSADAFADAAAALRQMEAHPLDLLTWRCRTSTARS